MGEPITLTVSDGSVQLDDGLPRADADVDITVSAADLIRLRRNSISASNTTEKGALRYHPRDHDRIREFEAAFALESTRPLATRVRSEPRR